MVYNRRIGERVLLGATQITWEPASDQGSVASNDPRWALLMDISVTGAGLFGPADPVRDIDDRLILGFNNARAVIEVRRLRPVDDAELCYYGVEFVRMDDEFERTLHDAIGRGRPKDSSR